ncbi:hypothetical protein [Sphingomonas daechungensis]|uniref:hypothetical protein n=1 Tax=Sphingomonas daechungensis TaxID=1176646 RepID=UPI0037830B7F
MPRLIPFPQGVKFTSRVPTAGPRSVSAVANEGVTGFIQTVQNLSGLWQWQFTFAPTVYADARAYRGFITAMHSGSNAARIPFRDPDLRFEDMGLTYSREDRRKGFPWSDGEYWSDGFGWSPNFGFVSVRRAAAKEDTVVALVNETWCRRLNVGDRIGFGPSHFGLYEITEVYPDDGFRIWPPLRKALTTDSYATLEPTMVMKLSPQQSAVPVRGVYATEAATISLIEIEDADVRSF